MCNCEGVCEEKIKSLESTIIGLKRDVTKLDEEKQELISYLHWHHMNYGVSANYLTDIISKNSNLVGNYSDLIGIETALRAGEKYCLDSRRKFESLVKV
jgi:hypothetical protein